MASRGHTYRYDDSHVTRDRPKTGFMFSAENETGSENELLFSARNRNVNENWKPFSAENENENENKFSLNNT